MKLYRTICACFVALTCAAVAYAANDKWNNINGGLWSTTSNWLDNSTPGNNDSATIDIFWAYTVTFNANPAAIQALNVAAFDVNFAGSGGPRTLSVNSPTGGTHDATISIGRLVLGNAGNPLHLSGVENLKVGNGASLAQLFATSGSKVTTVAVSVGQTGDGTIEVNGSGSELHWIGSAVVGAGGFDGALYFRNAATAGTATGAIFLAESNVAGTTGLLSVESGASLLMDDDLSLASGSTAVGTATLNIQGGSVFQLTDTSGTQVNVGNANGGSAAINIGTTVNGGSLSTGRGELYINNTGTVTVGSASTTGSLNARGNVVVTGGDLTVNSGSSFTYADMFVSSGGSATIAGDLKIDEDIWGSEQVVSVSGGALSVGGRINIASGFDVEGGLLSANGGTSSVVANSASPSNWCNRSGTGTITFSNGASGTFNGGINLAVNASGSAIGNVTVQSGADLSVGNLSMVTSSSTSATATITLTGTGSTLTLTPSSVLTVGDSANGTAVINVLDSSTLTVAAGGTTTLNPTGTINLNGGTLNTPTLIDNGAFNFASGTLGLTGPAGLTIGSGGLFGTSYSLGTGRTLNVTNTTIIDAGSTLSLDGGSLNTSTLVINGVFAFNAGKLGVTGAGGFTLGSGGLLGSTLTLGAGRTLNVSNTAMINSGSLLSIESGGTFAAGATSNSGTVSLGGATAVVGGTALNNSGLLRGEGLITAALNNQAAGEIRGESGKWLKFQGASNLNSGRINLLGGVVEFSQPVTNAASGQILGRGTLIVGGTGLNNNGQIILSNEATSLFGDVSNNTGNLAKGFTVTGNADVTFWDDVSHAAGSMFKVQAGASATFFGTFGGAGNITGDGELYFEADLTPGSSPASVSYDANVHFGAGASLVIELGGSTPDTQYDRLVISGSASLDGILDVSLINGFTPLGGQQFTILTAGSIVNNGFVLAGPAASSFDLFVNDTSVILQAIGLPGDYNFDGTVDILDYVVWRMTETPPDGYTAWSANYGEPSGNGAAGSTISTVPEPATWVMLVLAIAGYRRRKPRAELTSRQNH